MRCSGPTGSTSPGSSRNAVPPDALCTSLDVPWRRAYGPPEPEGFLTKRSYVTDHADGFTAGTPSLLRSMNERTVLELIRRRGPLSTAQVARDTGLSKPTVSLALSSLLTAGLVHQVGRSSGGKGPGALLYEIDPRAGWVVGIDVGRRWVRAAIADITGTIVARRAERAQVRSSRSVIGQIGRVAHELAAEAGVEWSHVAHATIGSPGVFDPTRGLVEMAPNLPGWGRHGIVQAVREHLGTNVSFENDVNLAALGERARGHGRNVSDFVYLWIGTGTGIGIVLRGELYRGSRGAAGEIGYLPIGIGDPHDPANRRRGAFEEAASAAGVVRAAEEQGMRSPGSAERVFAAAPGPCGVRGGGPPRGPPPCAPLGGGLARGVFPGGGGGVRSGDLLLEP